MNEYGLDVEYVTKELNFLLKTLKHRSPDELWRYLQVLSKIIEPKDEDINNESKDN